MSRAEDTRYSFETRPTRHTLLRAAEMADKLLLRLGVESSGLDRVNDDDQRALSAFTSACHLNIEWYDKHRTRQGRLYLVFGAFTALLVIAIPVAIFLTHAEASDVLAGQIGVIITGVLGAHRALASTLEKRDMERHFWKAQADLKSILYSFEDKWRGCSLTDVASADDDDSDVADADSQEDLEDVAPLAFASGFLQDLKHRTREALDVKRQEQEQFFANAAPRFSGITDILGVMSSSGSAILEASQQQKRERAAEINQVSDMEAIQRALVHQRDKLEKELAALAGSEAVRDVARREAIQRALDNVQRRLLDHDVELTIARTKSGVS